MKTITIAPLATPRSISLAVWDAVTHAPRLFLQTSEHPSARRICEAGIPFESMDDLYRAAEDFDALNAAIAARLFSAPEEDVVYAVPGRGVGQAQLETIRQAAETAGVQVVLLPASGYAEAALASLPVQFAADSLRILPATALPCRLDPYVPLCVEELDTRMRASEVKLALLEYYPDEFPVWLCTMDDAGDYSARSLPLYALDRQEGFVAASTLILRAATFEGLARHGLEGLERVMKRLRAPGGCPWDAELAHESQRSDLLVEAYAVLDAIDREDVDLPEGTWFIQDIIGLRVLDAATGAEYGTVADVTNAGAGDIYEIRTPDGRSVLFPAVPEFLAQVSPEQGFVKIRPIGGMFDDAD